MRKLRQFCPYPVPAGNWLYDFQEKAITEMLQFLRSGEASGVYNACECGVGKTIMSIVCSNELNCSSILVICPASVLLNWKKEFESWSLHAYEYLVVLNKKNIADIRRPAFTCAIVSHDLAKTKEGVLAITSRQWDMLILDESQRVKNRKSQRAQAILGPIWAHTKYRQALSGTPITGCVTDLFSLATKFAPSLFPNFYEFANKWAYLDRGPWGDSYYGIKNADILKKIIRSKFFVRYTKEEAKLELPAKTWMKVLLPKEYLFKVPATEQEILQAEVDAVTRSIEFGHKVPAVPKTIAGYRKAAALKKLPAVIEFVGNILEQQQAVVVFAYHTEVIDRIAKEFSNYDPVVIQGSTPIKERERAVKDFQESKTKLFIGQIIAAGVGITLTASSLVVFCEMDWVPSNIAQAVDRVARIGAKYPTNVYYFQVEGSVENRLLDVLVNKTKVFMKLVER